MFSSPRSSRSGCRRIRKACSPTVFPGLIPFLSGIEKAQGQKETSLALEKGSKPLSCNVFFKYTGKEEACLSSYRMIFYYKIIKSATPVHAGFISAEPCPLWIGFRAFKRCTPDHPRLRSGMHLLPVIRVQQQYEAGLLPAPAFFHASAVPGRPFSFLPHCPTADPASASAPSPE